MFIADRISRGGQIIERTLTPAEEAARSAAWAANAVPTRTMVDAERDRRLAAGFVFAGHLYQSRPDDRENIAGAKSMADDAIAAGAESGNFAWQKLVDPDNGLESFVWIVADNTLVPLDAQGVVALGYAALAHKQSLIFAANALKAMNPIPADYADNSHWPS